MSAQGSLLFDGGARCVDVAVPVPVEGLFSYRVPEDLEEAILPGMRVRVPFSGRTLDGIAIRVRSGASAAELEDLRPVIDCLDPEPLLSPVLLELAREVAVDLVVGWGEVLQLALPGFGDPGRNRRVRRRPQGDGSVGQLDRSARAVAGRLGERGDGWVRVGQIGGRIPGLHAAIYRLVRAGAVEIEDEWTGTTGGATRVVVRRHPEVSLEEALAATRRAPAQSRVVEWLWRVTSPTMPIAERRLVEDLEVSPGVIPQMERKGLVLREHVAAPSSIGAPLGAGGAGTFALTDEQASAFASVEAAMERAAARPILLHGVTGSGKTEVYLRAARRALAAGRSALLLVPEIGLTPQLEGRARAVLGDEVAVLHSGMSTGERQRAWWAVRRGDAKVVVGPRSAVFAPLDGIGLIVVDEEQDSAYKQEERPRYNGRDVALARARLESAAVVLGSATPAVESYHEAEVGRWELSRMPSRVAERPLPTVDLVDMRREWKEAGRTLVSRDLEQRISDRLERREQVLVLLNRRGFAASLRCRACGERIECPQCAVSLTLHRNPEGLRCHYCDHSQPVAVRCPQCGSEALRDLGSGTERLQGAMEKAWPGARVGRFDADQTQRRGAHGRILASFGAGEIDILVGTQMLAKGHDFPGVTLVGVIGADAALGMPDFRAGERTFQLLTQMAGRAGRGEIPGEVVVQANSPDHYAIQAALEHDFESFYAHEIGFRRRLRYPPFVALAACVCRGQTAQVVKEEADRLAAALRRACGAGAVVLGPASPPIARLRGQHRMQVLVKSPDRESLTAALRTALGELESHGQLPRDLVVDVDPRNMM